MRLVLICDDYLPFSTRVSAKMMHELALTLKQRGHDPIVICPNDQNNQESLTVLNIDGIQVYKFKSGPIKDVPKIKRAINETLLSINAWKSASKIINESRVDGVVYYSPSIFFGGFVKKIKRIWSCPSYLILRDLFPQWAIDEGIISNNSFIAKYFRFFEHKNYAAADHIGLMSLKNLQLFESLYPGHKCEVFRNWADISPVIKNSHNFVSVRDKLFLRDKVIFFYGGNIGHAQDMGNLMRLVRRMSAYEKAHFLFVGQGDEVNLINSLAKEWDLGNFTYLPSVNQDEFKNILAEVDIGLFSLSANHTAHNFPGKLLGYMVDSLPILGSVNKGNDLLDLVNDNEAGFIHVNGEDENLFSSAEQLYFDESLRRKIGGNAKQLLINQFSVNSAAKHIEKCLEAFNANT